MAVSIGPSVIAMGLMLNAILNTIAIIAVSVAGALAVGGGIAYGISRKKENTRNANDLAEYAEYTRMVERAQAHRALEPIKVESVRLTKGSVTAAQLP